MNMFSVNPINYSGSETEMKTSTSDWTDYFNRQFIIEHANELIDELILEIYAKKLTIHRSLSSKELALLYRFPIHVAVNTFIERLLRTFWSIEIKLDQTYLNFLHQPRYFRNTVESVQTYYYDLSLNYDLLRNIYAVLRGSDGLSKEAPIEQPKPQDLLLKTSGGLRYAAKTIFKDVVELYVRIAKPEVVGEYSYWMRGILPFGNLLRFEFAGKEQQIDNTTRDAIKNCSEEVFLRYVKTILSALDRTQANKVSVLFAAWIDHVLPLSIVEGLSERFSHYEKVLKNWGTKQVHSCTGYYYNENFKIFALLAKRKNALLISHAHGASNPTSEYKRICNELSFIDYYFTWGKTDSNWMKGDRKLKNLTILNLGSPYLSTIERWRKREGYPGSITLLYPSGPLMDFMSDLDEITVERNYQHRMNVLKLLKTIHSIWPSLHILYKPFPGTYANDPIKDLFRKELEEKAVELVDVRPLTLYDKVDIVLWDSISTGFAESIQSRVPTLVFHSEYEYAHAAEEGKRLDEALHKCGIIFHDIESGVKCFERVVDDLPGFMTSSKGAIEKFKEAVAYPIRRRDFRQKMRLTFLDQ